MPFFCFLTSEHWPVAHVERLEAKTLVEAQDQAADLLNRHSDALAARTILDAAEVAVLKVPGRLT